MATITQTLETLTFTAKAPTQKQQQKPEQKPAFCPPGCSCQTLEPACPPDCPCKTVCPPGCPCKTRSSKTTRMVSYAAGMVIAILAAYLMISTDSKMYLVFWVVYSVLRRMMLRTKKSLKEKTE